MSASLYTLNKRDMNYKVCTAIVMLACLSKVSGSCLGNQPSVFRDPHDGDFKVITEPYPYLAFEIQPYKNNESWVVYGKFDDNCVATVDFNVPNKPNPPPVNLTMTMYIMQYEGIPNRLGFECTDPSSTLAPANRPINFWVLHKWPKPDTVERILKDRKMNFSNSESCIDSQVVNDMHDGDQKSLTVKGASLRITPHGSQQKWSVDSKFDSTCAANVNFDVPGKPNPPPVPLKAEVWQMVSIAGADKDSLLFSDPSSTIAPASTTLNVWTADNK